MRPVALSDEIAVGEMPTNDELVILAKAGFRSVLNVQPDGEVERLPSADDFAKGAVAGGLALAFIPITSRRVPQDAVAAFALAMATLPHPIYACCYSGARAAAAWALAVAPTMAPNEVSNACAAAGFDMASLLPEIERLYQAKNGVIPSPESKAAAPQSKNAPTSSDAPSTASATAGSRTASAAVTSVEVIIFPRAAGAGGFAVSG